MASTKNVIFINMSDDENSSSDDDVHASEEHDYMSSDDDASLGTKMQKLTIRGPGMGGNKSFDKECIFGNLVEMNFYQVTQLASTVEDYPKQPIKRYVYTMTKSSVIRGHCKMEFSKNFTDSYLLGFLMAPIKVAVNCTSSEVTKYVKMMIGNNKKATLTRGWTSTVEEFKLKKDDICFFSFMDERGSPYRDDSTWLRLVIHKLEE